MCNFTKISDWVKLWGIKKSKMRISKLVQSNQAGSTRRWEFYQSFNFKLKQVPPFCLQKNSFRAILRSITNKNSLKRRNSDLLKSIFGLIVLTKVAIGSAIYQNVAVNIINVIIYDWPDCVCWLILTGLLSPTPQPVSFPQSKFLFQ